MALLDVLQLAANAALLVMSADVLRAMTRRTSHVRGWVFMFLAVCGFVGIVAAISRIPDSGADVLTAIGVALLMIVGCRPITRH